MSDSIFNHLQKTQQLQINVLNATDVSGIAEQTKEWLQSRGFDVVEVGNAPQKSDKSYIVDRADNYQAAEATANSLGISNSLIEKQIDTNHLICVSVILGYDYKSLSPFKTNYSNVK